MAETGETVASEYQRVLRTWALRNIPKHWNAQRVLDVDVTYDPGYHYSEYTYAEAHIDVMVRFSDADEIEHYWPMASDSEESARTLGSILSELFTIAEIDLAPEETN